MRHAAKVLRSICIKLEKVETRALRFLFELCHTRPGPQFRRAISASTADKQCAVVSLNTIVAKRNRNLARRNGDCAVGNCSIPMRRAVGSNALARFMFRRWIEKVIARAEFHARVAIRRHTKPTRHATRTAHTVLEQQIAIACGRDAIGQIGECLGVAGKDPGNRPDAAESAPPLGLKLRPLPLLSALA